jgi:hypothetical protein
VLLIGGAVGGADASSGARDVGGADAGGGAGGGWPLAVLVLVRPPSPCSGSWGSQLNKAATSILVTCSGAHNLATVVSFISGQFQS